MVELRLCLNEYYHKFCFRMNVFLLNPTIEEEIEEVVGEAEQEEDSPQTGVFIMVCKGCWLLRSEACSIIDFVSQSIRDLAC